MLRDTPLCQVLRLLCGPSIAYYPDELWTKEQSLGHLTASRQWRIEENRARLARNSQIPVPEETGRPGPRILGQEPSVSSVNHDPDPNYTHSSMEPGAVASAVDKVDNSNLVDWDGPNDPSNPLNWSPWKKALVAGIVVLLTMAIDIGASIYSSGEPSIQAEWNISEPVAVLGLSLYVIGYGFGCMVWSPLSEITSIGRNPVYVITLIIFVAIQVPTALSNGLPTLLPLRFLAGFFGSPALATGGATLGDIYTPRTRAYAVSIWGGVAVIGPALGPLLGGFVADARGWRWTIWVLLWLSGGCLGILILCFPETSTATLLYRKARRLRRLTGNMSLHCSMEMPTVKQSRMKAIAMTLAGPFILCFLEPTVFFCNIYIALVYALLYITFESFPIVFGEVYMFNGGEVGLAFLGIVIGALLATILFCCYLYYYLEARFDQDGRLQPIELRLQPALVGGFCIPLGLFLFGWSSRVSIPWIVPIIGSAFISIGIFLLFQAILNYLQDAYTSISASVLAGNVFVLSMLGGAFPIFATGMYHQLGIGWASSTLAFLSLPMIPIPFALYYWGKTLRGWSKYADK